MIDFLQEVFVFFIFATPAMAVVALLVGLFVKEVRWGILPGFLGIAIGFYLGASLNGGWGRTDSWGNYGYLGLGGAIFGVCYGAAGFLIGFGAGCTKYGRLGAWILITAGSAFPLAHFGFVELRPVLERSEMAWWKPILANGSSGVSVDEARAHLSEPTRMALEGQYPIAPSTLRLLYQARIINVSRYIPLPPDLAEEIYAQQPNDYNLARNPSTPPDILEKFVERDDPGGYEDLCRNTGLPQPLADKLKQRFKTIIETESKKANPDWYWINTAKERLEDLEVRQKAVDKGG